MKIPKDFKYKGHNWSIIIEKNLHHEDGTKCLGLCDTNGRVIYLEANLKHKEKLSALYHEIFHVLVKEAHIPEDAPMTETIEDILAEAMADMMENLFKVNWR